MDGVTGDGVRTVPLSFKATVKLIESLMEWVWVLSALTRIVTVQSGHDRL